MPTKRYGVNLRLEERKMLEDICHKGKSSAKTIMHAHILLSTDESQGGEKATEREIAKQFGISTNTVNQVKKTYARDGLDAALNRKTRITAPNAVKITGDVEAHIIATALSEPPKGFSRWTLRLIAEYCVATQYIVSLSHTSVGEILNTNELKPHLNKYWCIPKENDAAFVAHMEDVLSIYKRPYNAEIPVICMDEKPVQLLGEIRERISAKPLRIDAETELPKSGTVEKVDSEYIRCGTASIFMFTEPLGGWRHTVALKRRTKGDFAYLMQQISDNYYPHVKKIILVADNLNTHNSASFYEAFAPETAFRLSQKFEFHYTPKHGSWLNIAETGLSALSVQCLGDKRIDSIDELNECLSLWEVGRNFRQKGVNWHFTAEDARIKLKRLYPVPIF